MILPGGQPYLLPGGPFGCLLIHSFASSPQEMRWLGTQLNQNGFSILAIRLFGHATSSEDLRRARYSDWIASMEDGFSLLRKQCDKLIVVGASLGSALALIAGAKLSVDALVAISPPYDLLSYSQTGQLNLPNPVLRMLKLGKRPFRTLSSLPGLVPQDETMHIFYPAIPTRIISEVELLLNEMRRVLPNVDVPTLLIHTDVNLPGASEGKLFNFISRACPPDSSRGDSKEKDVQFQDSMQILDRLQTKRVKILRIKRSGSEETIQLERERVTGAITTFVTSLPGFQQ